MRETLVPVVGSEFVSVVLPLIKAAKSSIKIIVYDWRWYPSQPHSVAQQFNEALVQASRRGVVVEVITNIRETVQVLQQVGIKAQKLATEKLVHVKLMIIDDKDVIIGSHNYTQNAFTVNFELSLLVKDCGVVGRFLDFFKNLRCYGSS